MKLFSAALAMAATASAAAIPAQQISPSDPPKGSAAIPPPVEPYGLPELIASGTALFGYLSNIFSLAKNDLNGGKPLNQVIGDTIPKVLPEVKLLNKVAVQGKQLRQGSTTAKALFGPYHLVGKNDYRPMIDLGSLDPRGQARLSYLPKGSFCDGKDCTILSARLSLSYEDGSVAVPETGVYIHHLLSFVVNRQSVNSIGLCDVTDLEKDNGLGAYVNKVFPTQMPIAPFTGRGEDGGPVSNIFTSDDGKFDSGFHLGKDDYIVVQSDLVNYNNVTQNVYLTFDYEYVDGLQGMSAITMLLSVTGCLLIIPPKIDPNGRAITESRKFPILNDAVIINMRGHMHDGGDKMLLSINNKTVCESEPEYHGRELWSMSACGGPIDVKKGDWITLTSIYDVPKHPLRSGVMDTHSHAKNILGLNDLMGMYGVTFASKTKIEPIVFPVPGAAAKPATPASKPVA